jgi:hypothetical protein
VLRRGWWGAAPLAIAVLGLAACNPAAGEGTFTVTGAEQATASGPSVVCRPPGDGGETVTPTWEWTGSIDGEDVTLAFAGMWEPTAVDAGSFMISGRQYVAFDRPGGSLVRHGGIDADGTLHVAATLAGPFGGGTVEVEADLRCPSWPVGS